MIICASVLPFKSSEEIINMKREDVCFCFFSDHTVHSQLWETAAQDFPVRTATVKYEDLYRKAILYINFRKYEK